LRDKLRGGLEYFRFRQTHDGRNCHSEPSEESHFLGDFNFGDGRLSAFGLGTSLGSE
jgi:hypothetical protein